MSSTVAGWDVEADVVVVGLGVPGACAAHRGRRGRGRRARARGVRWAGGTSAMSGGLIYLGGGTPIQEACGFDRHGRRHVPVPDGRLRARGRRGQGPRLLRRQRRPLPLAGRPRRARSKPGSSPSRAASRPTDAGLVYSAAVRTRGPFTDVARPVPRGHQPQKPRRRRRLPHAAPGRARSGQRRPASRPTPGRATGGRRRRASVGVIGRQAGRDVAIRARRGVVLSAGGFVFNRRDGRREHCPLVAALLRAASATTSTTARGIRMAPGDRRRGRCAWTRLECRACPLTPPRSLGAGILVNGQGQRFINEDTYNGRVGQEILLRQDGRGLPRASTRRSTPSTSCRVAGRRGCARPSTELEGEIGLPAGLAHVDARPLQHARGRRRRPDVPQGRRVGAAAGAAPRRRRPAGGERPLLRDRSPSAGWSPRSTARCATVDDRPIPGLFAAGRTTCGHRRRRLRQRHLARRRHVLRPPRRPRRRSSLSLSDRAGPVRP